MRKIGKKNLVCVLLVRIMLATYIVVKVDLIKYKGNRALYFIRYFVKTDQIQETTSVLFLDLLTVDYVSLVCVVFMRTFFGKGGSFGNLVLSN